MSEQEILGSLRATSGRSALKWSMFSLLVVITYAAFFFGLVLTIARIDGEFVGEVGYKSYISPYVFP